MTRIKLRSRIFPDSGACYFLILQRAGFCTAGTNKECQRVCVMPTGNTEIKSLEPRMIRFPKTTRTDTLSLSALPTKRYVLLC